MKYIYHHLGLGDHIICNGLVNYIQKDLGEEITVFCKNHNFKNVEYLYRHNDKINVFSPYGIGDDSHVLNYIEEKKLQKDLIRIGFEQLDGSHDTTFDQEFYIKNNIPWSVRFDFFEMKRDIDEENFIYNQLNPNNEEYIFVHGNLNMEKIRSDLKIIKNPDQYSIFNILKLIENSTECHLMESSVKCLVNSYKFDKPKFYYHQYVRGYDEWYNSKGLNKYEIIF